MGIRIRGIGPVLCCGAGMAALGAALGKHRDNSFNKDCSNDYQVSTAELDDFVSPRKSRRLDRFSRMALLAAHLALNDAGVAVEELSGKDTGIVLGTGLGPLGSTFANLDGMIDNGDNCVSSFAFTNSVHNTGASQVSLIFGICGPVRTVTTFSYSVGNALGTAVSWLRNNIVKRVLLILGEEASEVTAYCTMKLGGGGPVQPFSRGCSSGNGEGCVAFVLEREGRGYCSIAFLDMCLTVVEAAGRSAACDMLFCAAMGKADEYEDYRRLWTKAPLAGAYSALYGSLFTGLGVELAVAALCLREQVLFPVPGSREIEETTAGIRLPGAGKCNLKKIGAVAVCGPDKVTFVELQ